MRKNDVKEKKHRLSLPCYKGQARVTFTLCIEDRKPLFTQKNIVKKFTEILKAAEDKFDCKNWVYIFMPDHLHLITEGNTAESDLCKMVTLFKQKTGFWLSRNKTGIRWQKDFYDPI